ncbi:MAG: S8 family serine peptidase [Ruminococcus sp.]|uniref:S8 family peptidase n=1 Tax=Ruminococcus sp. TaxID=41978 RepID=UPI0025DB0BC3|nr:S8 family peptidase [Ruminococcus sp.]MBR5684282.1 S8 family serine peptidase [Ruminococcus sp.]
MQLILSCFETEKVWKSLKNSRSPGKGAIVAVIDTGVDYNHKDLAANIWTNPGEKPNNGIDDDENGYVDDVHGINAITGSGDPMDDHGHGTHVAGAIAMTAGNGGGIGLAYGAQIMCIKAGRSDGTFASYDIAKAVKYAVDNGADIINMSFGGVEKSQVVEAALNEAAESAVLVASAGNDGLPTSEAYSNGYKNCMDSYPAGYSCVIGVMASDNYDRLASFSNWDYLSGKGCEYEMTAPGTDIYSTLPDNRYAVWSGTSLSASMVSAAAAIIRSEYPNKSKYNAKYTTGQLINAPKSRASAEPATVTVPVSTTSETATSVTTSTTTYVKSEDPLVNADVDGIEGITKDDFAYMLKGLVGINELSGSMGDVNCDGAADMFDAVSILRLCNNRDSLKDIMDSATISKEIIYFNIPSVNIEEDGSCTKYTFTYNSNLPFKAITGQLKFNGKPYSGEFDDIKLIESSSGEILYEFNPENGKFAAYCENNGTNGSFTISTYEGKDGSYAIDMNSLTFYDENGKEFRDFELRTFRPELTKKSVEAQNVATAAAVGNPTAVAVYDKKVEYPRLNIIDSLTVQPRPDLRIMDVVKSILPIFPR